MTTKHFGSINPRNFKEKIELLKLKEAASTANFAAAMRDAREICQIACACENVLLSRNLGGTPPKTLGHLPVSKAHSLTDIDNPNTSIPSYSRIDRPMTFVSAFSRDYLNSAPRTPSVYAQNEDSIQKISRTPKRKNLSPSIADLSSLKAPNICPFTFYGNGDLVESVSTVSTPNNSWVTSMGQSHSNPTYKTNEYSRDKIESSTSVTEVITSSSQLCLDSTVLQNSSALIPHSNRLFNHWVDNINDGQDKSNTQLNYPISKSISGLNTIRCLSPSDVKPFDRFKTNIPKRQNLYRTEGIQCLRTMPTTTCTVSVKVNNYGDQYITSGRFQPFASYADILDSSNSLAKAQFVRLNNLSGNIQSSTVCDWRRTASDSSIHHTFAGFKPQLLEQICENDTEIPPAEDSLVPSNLRHHAYFVPSQSLDRVVDETRFNRSALFGQMVPVTNGHYMQPTFHHSSRLNYPYHLVGRNLKTASSDSSSFQSMQQSPTLQRNAITQSTLINRKSNNLHVTAVNTNNLNSDNVCPIMQPSRQASSLFSFNTISDYLRAKNIPPPPDTTFSSAITTTIAKGTSQVIGDSKSTALWNSLNGSVITSISSATTSYQAGDLLGETNPDLPVYNPHDLDDYLQLPSLIGKTEEQGNFTGRRDSCTMTAEVLSGLNRSTDENVLHTSDADTTTKTVLSNLNPNTPSSSNFSVGQSHSLSLTDAGSSPNACSSKCLQNVGNRLGISITPNDYRLLTDPHLANYVTDELTESQLVD